MDVEFKFDIDVVWPLINNIEFVDNEFKFYVNSVVVDELTELQYKAPLIFK